VHPEAGEGDAYEAWRTFHIGHPTAEAGLSPRRRLSDVVES
jgi:hypothetical protein